MNRGLLKTLSLESRMNWPPLKKKYGMTTDQFIEKYSRGEMADTPDFVEWSGLYHIYQRLLKKQSQLYDIQIVR